MSLQDMVEIGSSLRKALPDLIRLMLDFTIFAIHPPVTEYEPYNAENVYFAYFFEILVHISVCSNNNSKWACLVNHLDLFYFQISGSDYLLIM